MVLDNLSVVMELKQKFYDIVNDAEYLKIKTEGTDDTFIIKLEEVSYDDIDEDLTLYGTCYAYDYVYDYIKKREDVIFNFDLSTLSVITKNEFDEVEDAYNRIIGIIGKN